MSRFIQIHTLTAWPATLLNRDDAGYAKRLPFGGAVRTRVSSQCLKRHWRTSDGPHSLDALESEATIRSRHAFDHFVRVPLATEVEENLAEAIAGKIQELLIGISAKKSKSKKEDEEAESSKVKTAQVVVLGKPELDYALKLAREAAEIEGITAKNAAKKIKEWLDKGEMKKNIAAIKLASGLSGALFGRMVTGDVLAQMDAAIHVAHAFTVHAQDSEPDYFSAVDDLVPAGSGHINTTELTTGLFYGYVVIDVPLLVSNLGNDPALAGQVVERLMHLITTESPGAKKGSTAPYTRAHWVFVETGDTQPRTLANAFLNPVSKQDLVANTYDQVTEYMAEIDGMYGRDTERRYAAVGASDSLSEVLGEQSSVIDLGKWLNATVQG